MHLQTPVFCLGLVVGLGLLWPASESPAQPNAASSGADLWASDPLAKVLRSAKRGEAPAERLQFSGARREIASGQAVFVTGHLGRSGAGRPDGD